MSNRDTILKYLERAGIEKLRSRGENATGICPFHQKEKGTPSFSMNLDSGVYFCWSTKCGAKGSFARFLHLQLGYTWDKSFQVSDSIGVERVCSREDVSRLMPPYQERRRSADTEQLQAVPDMVLGAFEGTPRFLTKRGFDRKLLRQWDVGIDRETRAVTIPLKDHRNGDIIGISKRFIDEDNSNAKYAHLGFKTSRHLYGYWEAKECEEVVVVESQFDVIAWQQLTQGSGLAPAVSPMTARVSRHHVRLLKRFDRVVLAFDNFTMDEGGRRATMVVGSQLSRILGMGNVTVFRYPKGIKDFTRMLGVKPRIREKYFRGRLVDFDTWKLRVLN